MDSSDIGKTPLIEMEIDTGDSPLITQEPYTLPFKTCCVGTKGVRNIGKGWSDNEKCLTLG